MKFERPANSLTAGDRDFKIGPGTVDWDRWMRIRAVWGHDGKKPRNFSI